MEFRRVVTFQTLIFFSLIGIDQLSKWWASQHGWVTWNHGVAFGVALEIVPWLVNLGLLCLVGGVGWLLSKINLYSQWGSVVLLAGATSNLIDRFGWGAVRDWLPLPFTGLTNNLADWYISFGIIWLGWTLWRAERVSKSQV